MVPESRGLMSPPKSLYMVHVRKYSIRSTPYRITRYEKRQVLEREPRKRLKKSYIALTHPIT